MVLQAAKRTTAAWMSPVATVLGGTSFGLFFQLPKRKVIEYYRAVRNRVLKGNFKTVADMAPCKIERSIVFTVSVIPDGLIMLLPHAN